MSNTLLKYINNRGLGTGIDNVQSYDSTSIPEASPLLIGQEIQVGSQILKYDANNALPIQPIRCRFKKMPLAGDHIGMCIVTDIGDPYSVWYSDGLNWKPFAGSLIIEQAHQTGNAMTGSSASGTSDLGFGLSSNSPRFPLGKQFDILSNLLGRHGSLKIRAKFTATNNSNNHEIGLAAGLKYTTPTIIFSDTNSLWNTKYIDLIISNRGTETTKTVSGTITTLNGTITTSNIIDISTTFDTSIDQKLWFYGCLLGSASDTITLESFVVELLRN